MHPERVRLDQLAREVEVVSDMPALVLDLNGDAAGEERLALRLPRRLGHHVERRDAPEASDCGVPSPHTTTVPAGLSDATITSPMNLPVSA